ncbi:uncharacterized protein LOC111634704 [Centruroides sculpturatus]|uniref:uncharacterized protein LOC111634704 n=1 Tax=Centruroides sculpturatus TaxID=218467 RepID=UPI000C6CEFAB|nr:uncharacterized protein LOC111634704 [Centruroides sculpturatus]
MKEDREPEDNENSSHFREQLEIFELLKKSDCRHEMLKNMGMNWFYDDTLLDQTDSDSEDDVRIVINSLKDDSKDAKIDDDKENVSPDWKKRKSNLTSLDTSQWSLKRIAETSNVRKRIREMERKRQALDENFETNKGTKISKMIDENDFYHSTVNSAFSEETKDAGTEKRRTVVENADS